MRIRQKALSLLLALALTLGVLPGAAFAEEPLQVPPEETEVIFAAEEAMDEPQAQALTSSGYCGENDGTNVSWTLSGDGTLTISGSGKMKDFAQPNEEGGITIYPTEWKKTVVRAVVQEGVTNVGSCAFYDCPLLESVQLPGSVQTIGYRGIAWNDNLRSLEITEGANGRVIEDGSLRNCHALEKITIPEGFTSIQENAFYACTNLKSITLPDSLTTVGVSAFENCHSLTEVVLPKNVTSVGRYAFDGCPSLTTVKAPSGLSLSGALPGGSSVSVDYYVGPTPDTSTGGNTGGNTEKPPVTPPSGPTLISEGDCGKIMGRIRAALYSDGTLTIEGTGEMVDYSFAPYWTENASSASIKSGVTSVGSSVFQDRAALRTVELADTITSIGQLAFYGCTGLKSVTLPAGLTSIGAAAFRNCTGLTDIEIPAGVKRIETWAFKDSGLTHARVPSSAVVASEAFPAGCRVEIYNTGDIPVENLTVVSSGSCGKSGSNLTYTLYENGLLVIKGTGEMADYKFGQAPWYYVPSAAVTKVEIGSGVSSIGTAAFYNCGNLTEVRLPDTVKTIGTQAFAQCSGLERAELPGVTVIGSSAFSSCSKLTLVQFGKNLTEIGNSAFNQTGLKGELTLPESLKYIRGGAFTGTALTTVRVYYQTDYVVYTPGSFSSGCRVELYGAPALTPSGTPLKESGLTAPVGSDNIHAHSYLAWSEPVYTYLASGSSGGFRRVDCTGGRVMMEEYDKDANFLRSWEIPAELSSFGGFYESDDAYYFAFANPNHRESDTVETVRVVKYTKDLRRVGAASLYGGNIYEPFYMGSLRMTEGDGILYVYMARQMYADSTNTNHQASAVLSIDTDNMRLLCKGTDLYHPFYVSHSMNQFIKYDSASGQVVALSQGDTYPRALTVMKAPADLSEKSGEARFLIPGGRSGSNHTLAEIGGLEVANGNYLAAYASINQNGFDITRTFNAYLSVINKSTMTYRNIPLTQYAEGGPVSASNPILVKVSDNRFAVLWEEQLRKEQVVSSSLAYYLDKTNNQVCFAYYDGSGNKLSGVHRMAGALSDCQPIVVNGSIIWYVTEDGKAPVFYRITGETGGVLKSYDGTAPTPPGGDTPPAAEIAASGNCGKSGSSVAWTLYKDGTLMIEGTGEIKDCTSYSGVTGESTAKTACTKVVIGEGVTGIGKYAFNGYTKLESVKLPSTLKSIGDYAFQNCSALKAAALPQKLESIGTAAFYGCRALTEIELPQSVRTLGTQPFGSSGLTRARVYYTLKYSSGTFPANCMVTLYGKTLTPDAPLKASRTSPLKSENLHRQNYNGRFNTPNASYICAGEGGDFYRVEYSKDSGLVMEQYSQTGGFRQGWDIPMELPLFGGFYAGSNAFYFVFGRNNPSHSDSVEVLRVVKYTKNLERLGEAKLMGGNTAIPFDASSCRMAEGNGLLYIHAGHEMYNGHQACMTFSVDTESMEFQYQFYDVANPDANGYVSHSFNQFVQVDGTNVVRLDHGDGYPRGAGLFVNGPSLTGRPALYKVPFSFSGGTGENVTGASVGGLEVSASAYLTALSSVNQNSGKRNNNKTYNVYLLATNKTSGTTTTTQLTNYSEGGAYSASTPQLVKFSDNRFLLLWEEQTRTDYSGGYYYSQYTGQVKYVFLDGAGNRTGSEQSMSGALSDCQPALINGKASWYTTERYWNEEKRGYEMTEPTFYQIDSSGKSSSFTAAIGQKPPALHGTVNVSATYAIAGEEMSLTVKPDPGYYLSKIQVTDSAGREVSLRKNSDGSVYSFTMPSADVNVTVKFEKR